MASPNGVDRHPLEQRRRRLKRTLLRPFGPVALRLGQGGGPAAARELLLRKVAFPYLRARDELFEQRVGDGVFVGRTTDMLSMYVLAFGVWEPHLSGFVRGRLGPGDVFVDVGANSGWYTVLAAQCVGPDGGVVAIEPSAAIVDRLRTQIERNHLANVRVVEEAVSDHVGRVAVEPGPAEHTGLTRALRDAGDERSVPCRPLPEMIESREWDRIRLIKMDVEGAEFAAVRGLADRLETLPEAAEVVVEVGPQRAQAPSDVEALFCAFTSAGYTPYAIPNEYEVRDYLGYAPVRSLPRLEPASVNREVNVVFSRAGGDDLAVHAEWRG